MQWILAVLALVSLNAFASDATLEIVAGKERLIFSQSQLLSRSDVETISVAGSVYERRFTLFKAIPIGNLFRGLPIPELAAVQCSSTDGFSAILDKTRLLGTDPKASKAYLAIEDPKSPWPTSCRKNKFRGTVLSRLDKPRGIRHRTGGMALPDCLISCLIGPARRICEDLSCPRCGAKHSKWI